MPLCALLLVGCGVSLETSATESKQQDSKIREVYDAYKANGGTLDYDTWLESIKGKDGVNGKDGADGKDGVSIVSITKTSSSGNVDTYTIAYSDGSTSTFTVTNGVDGADGSQGIQGIQGEKGFRWSYSCYNHRNQWQLVCGWNGYRNSSYWCKR